MQHPDKHTCMRPENIDETLVTNLCNIRVQPLQHMQHPDLLLQHPSENTCNIPFKHSKHTLVTCAFNKTWQPNGRSMAQRDPSYVVAVEKDGSRLMVVRPPAIGRTRCPRWRRQHQSGGAASRSEHAVVLRAQQWQGGRLAGGAVEREAWRSRGGVTVMREFFLICGDRRGAEGADRNNF
jgi:hypothetical protein